MKDTVTAYVAERLGEEFLALKVRRAAVDRLTSTIFVECVFPRVLKAEEKRVVEQGLRELLPASFQNIRAEYKKSYIDHEVLARDVMYYFAEHLSAVRARLTEKDFDVDLADPVKVEITFDVHTYELVEKQKLLFQLQNYLNGRYCNDFLVVARTRESTQSPEQLKSELQEKSRLLEEEQAPNATRVFCVDNRREFIGKPVEEPARFIGDAAAPAENIVLAGKVSRLSCRVVSSGKTMFKFQLEDFSGKIGCTYFPAAQNVERVTDELVEGSEIIARGVLKLDNFTRWLVFVPRAITMCTLPEDFAKPEIVPRKVPEEYSVVFPEKLVVGEQVTLLGSAQSVPASLVGKRYVVFDLETTGLEPETCRITEIGAISIEDGEIAESFSTLVNPECFIPEEITRLTGIDEEMVRNAPTIDRVLPDFYRFTAGAVLVAHNIEFDSKFLDKYGREQRYIFDNPQMDTLRLAHEQLKGLSNYKLNTVAESLGVDLKGHHRAINDVLATAQIFLKLMRMREEGRA